MLQKYLTPRWLAAHVIVVIVVGAFIRLGIWQLDRLEERRAQNETVAARMEMPPIGFDSLLAGVPESEREFRRVVVTGIFDVDQEVLIRSRTHNGEAGFHVVTPLVSDTGVTVLVNRGWVPLDLDEPPVGPALPPMDAVEVAGTVRDSQSAPSLGPDDPPEGRLQRLYWVDIPRLQQQIPDRAGPGVCRPRLPVPGATRAAAYPGHGPGPHRRIASGLRDPVVCLCGDRNRWIRNPAAKRTAGAVG